MSGHSKWHNIQKTKGAADAKRSQIFTKIAREMIVAVKTGGSGDPNNNSRLATVIAKAKAANMPNDNIKRTIDKALGADDMQVEEETFEVYTDPDAFGSVLAALEEKGYTFVQAAVEMVPQNYVKLENEDDIKNMEKLIDLLEDNDDVQNVWHNWDQE